MTSGDTKTFSFSAPSVSSELDESLSLLESAEESEDDEVRVDVVVVVVRTLSCDTRRELLSAMMFLITGWIGGSIGGGEFIAGGGEFITGGGEF